MSSPAPPIAPAMASPTPPVAECPTPSSLLALPDVNLEDIFLRLPTPAALARASLACAAFRRIITERSFLRRFRKLHPPPLLGIIDDEGVFVPTEAPHPSAPLSRALVQGADFTYSFVPKPLGKNHTIWSPCDVRDGRVLLEHRRSGAHTFFTDLAVCDPLSRRYLLLPPIPEDMTIEQERLDELRHFLIPIRENEDETSLKVICLAYYRSKLVTFIFSSVTGQWCIAATTSWSSLGVVDPFRRLFSCFNYFRGCFYWSLDWEHKLLVLDTHRMAFSTLSIHHPAYYMKFIGQPEHIRCMPTVVEDRKGALEVFNLVGDPFESTPFDLTGGPYNLTPFYIYHTFRQKGESSSEWQLLNVMELPRGYCYYTVGAAEGFLFLGAGGIGKTQPDDWGADVFSLEVKTSQLKKVCRATNVTVFCFQSYFGFPPSLSTPSL
ncbi:hypothetical protein CFC21_087205 [Triticum aestivum]|uniref:F-box domain-containing protein n=3 Tax=Triticum TaxID=4564 RepID=A0A9R0YGH1_TRITD|nr:uncharacterized protein LOC123136171 isoform X1 [Triticum aestivum]XP_044411425.1 uncharacterized protein LOC123136171 isoform X1 [Triticum aestivum]KAF7083407.1 hypothetical protein CFC21_087205 [Triticum aestivum]VAI54968.1 unnamed protein product [Triticum turgidum subsp. durum]